MKKGFASNQYSLKLQIEDLKLQNKELSEKIEICTKKLENEEQKCYREKQSLLKDKDEIALENRSLKQKLDHKENDQVKSDALFEKMIDERNKELKELSENLKKEVKKSQTLELEHEKSKAHLKIKAQIEENLKKDLKALKNQLLEFLNEREKMMKVEIDLKKQLSEKESKVKSMKQDLDQENQEKIKELQKKVAVLKADNEKLLLGREDQSNEFKKLRKYKNLQEVKEKLHNDSTQVSFTNYQKESDSYKSKISDLEQKVIDLTLQNKELQMELKYKEMSHQNQTSIHIESQNKEKDQLWSEKKELQMKHDELMKKYQRLKEKLCLANKKVVELLKEKQAQSFVQEKPQHSH